MLVKKGKVEGAEPEELATHREKIALSELSEEGTKQCQSVHLNKMRQASSNPLGIKGASDAR